MSVLFHTTVIPLGWKPHREHDRSYSAFSREHGKIEFIAKGGQKPLAKLTPHLETHAESSLLLVQGRQYFTVAGVDRLRSFPALYADLLKTTLVQNAFVLVDLGTRWQEEDEELYGALIEWMEFVSRLPSVTSERAAFLLASFTLKFLAHIGYRPELHVCLACRRPIEASQFRWYALKGGVVCASCAIQDREQWFSARPIADSVLKAIRFALTEPYEEQLRPHLSGELLLSFHEAVESLLIAHFPVIPAASLREACRHC